MGKINKMALGLITELTSIRDELGSAINNIDGEGREDVIHAYNRLTDLAANVSIFAGQFNLQNLMRFLKRSTRGG
jgi:hypothetical protein